MRRIIVFERDGSWHFSSPDGEVSESHRSALDAADAARAYGETLQGHTLGYVIRLHPTADIVGDQNITLHTRVF